MAVPSPPLQNPQPQDPRSRTAEPPSPSAAALDGSVGFFEAVYTTRALRRFRPDPIPEDVLFQIMDAAIRAPTGQNAQDWRFLVVTDPGVKARMQEWARQGWQRYRPDFADDPAAIDALPRAQRLSLKSVEHLTRHLAQVPAIVLVCGLRGRHATPGGSAFPAVQNLLLAARALGVGGSIFNMPLAHAHDLTELLAIPKSNVVYCLVPLGYPSDRIGPVTRKPVKKVVYWEKFGQEWPFAAQQPDAGWQDRWLTTPKD